MTVLTWWPEGQSWVSASPPVCQSASPASPSPCLAGLANSWTAGQTGQFGRLSKEILLVKLNVCIIFRIKKNKENWNCYQRWTVRTVRVRTLANNWKTNCLFTRLESLASSQKGFWLLSFCRNMDLCNIKLQFVLIGGLFISSKKKSRKRETLNLTTDADIDTIAMKRRKKT